jgi:hypothetical protein
VDRLPALCHVFRLIDGSIVCRREFPAAAPEHSQGPTILRADHADNELGFRRTMATRNTFSTLGSFRNVDSHRLDQNIPPTKQPAG